MQVQNFRHFGGRHFETTAMKNILAHAGLLSPITGQPLSEAMCLGIAGGIAAGYSFCPSIPSYDEGSGVSVVGRYRAYVTGPEYYTGLFDKLKIRVNIKETTSEKSAYKHLVDAISANRPAIVWCSPYQLPYTSRPATFGMYSFIVFGIDANAGVALVSDRGPTPWEMPLPALALARKQVCSHKNRLMTLESTTRLSAEGLKAAVLSGIQACVRDLMVPHIKTFNLPGLLEWAHVLASTRNKKGWPVVYSDGNLYPALRDTFDSIETGGTGGKLFRDMYAEFLEEAAVVTGREALVACAEQYRTLGTRWQKLALQTMPDSQPAFVKTVELLRERQQLVETLGAPARPRLLEIRESLEKLDGQMRDHFPLDPGQAHRLLVELSAEIEQLYEGEMDAAEALERAIRS